MQTTHRVTETLTLCAVLLQNTPSNFIRVPPWLSRGSQILLLFLLNPPALMLMHYHVPECGLWVSTQTDEMLYVAEKVTSCPNRQRNVRERLSHATRLQLLAWPGPVFLLLWLLEVVQYDLWLKTITESLAGKTFWIHSRAFKSTKYQIQVKVKQRNNL